MAALDQSSSWLSDPQSALAPTSPSSTTTSDTTPPPLDKSKDTTPPPANSNDPFKSMMQPPGGASQQDVFKMLGDLEKQKLDIPRPTPPKLNRPTTPQDDFSMLGSLGIVFAALAARRTRTPMTTALNGMAAAITAMRNGQKEQADQAIRQAELDSKFALENFNLEQRAYEDMVDQITQKENFALNVWGKLDNENEAKFRTMMNVFGDAVGLDTYEKYGWDAFVNLQKQKEEAKQKYQEKMLENRGNYEVMKILDNDPEFQAAVASGDREKATAIYQAVTAKVSPGKITMTDEAVDAAAQRVVKGDEPWPGLRGSEQRTEADNQRIIDKIEELNDASEAQGKERIGSEYYQAKQQAEKTYAPGGKGADRIQSIGTLSGHLDSLEKAEENLPKDDAAALERLQLWFARQYDPSIASFDVAKSVAADELNKVLVPSGGGEMERSAWQKIFDAQTPDQMKAAVDQAKEMVRSRVGQELKTASRFDIHPLSEEQLKYWGLDKNGNKVEESSESKPPVAPAKTYTLANPFDATNGGLAEAYKRGEVTEDTPIKEENPATGEYEVHTLKEWRNLRKRATGSGQ